MIIQEVRDTGVPFRFAGARCLIAEVVEELTFEAQVIGRVAGSILGRDEAGFGIGFGDP